MALLEEITLALTAAMKARDAPRLSTLRMAKSALKNREIEKMAPLDEAESMKVLQTLVKQRRDSAEQYTQAGRQELADKELAEIKVIEEYMPASLDEETLSRLVDEAIVEISATSVKDMGRVMKAVMARLGGQPVDGKIVSGLVKTKLGG
ncbi:MAG: GatB/YqeY domain-containing protein [Acidobacteriota bacterium]